MATTIEELEKRREAARLGGGEKRQSSNTNQLIFPVPELVAFVTQFCTLEPGDIITTGTPSGVGPLQVGDRVMVKVEGVGALSNPCVEA